MTFDPGYAQTSLPFNELDTLTPEARDVLEEPITKATVDDLEQAIEIHVTEQLRSDILEDRLRARRAAFGPLPSRTASAAVWRHPDESARELMIPPTDQTR